MKRRLRGIVSWLCVLSLCLSLLPTTALAADGDGWQVGEQWETPDPQGAPPENIPSGTVWSGPTKEHGELICAKEEHEHSAECYEFACKHEHSENAGCYAWVECNIDSHWETFLGIPYHIIEGTSCLNRGQFFPDWGYYDYENTDPCSHEHDEDCYNLICDEGHTHTDECYELTYVWTLQYKNQSGDDWRAWWPVYWRFERDSWIKDSSVVTVESGSNDVTYASGAVSAQNALDDEEAANAGMLVSNGVQITQKPGYYLDSYRLVCGNHDRTGSYCGVATRPNDTEFSDGDYDSTVNYEVGTDRESDDGMRINHGYDLGRNYPSEKPSSPYGNEYDGSDQIYPFYLLLSVKEDNSRYGVTYNWGDLGSFLSDYDTPEDQYDLLRNEEVIVEAPSADAVNAALEEGWVFTGWEIDAKGYLDGSVVNANHELTITGDITLTAKWVHAGTPGESDLAKIKVTVACTNQNADHEAPSTLPYGLIEGSYSGSSHINDNGDLEYTVTVSADDYVEKYTGDTDVSHTLACPDADTVTFVYDVDKQEWVLADGEDDSVTFNVVCDNDFTVTYDPNGGTLTVNGDNYTTSYVVTVNGGEAHKVISEEPARPGYSFDGWYDDDTEYEADQSITETTTLTAQWTENTVTINYEVVGPVGSGSVSRASETVNAATGTAEGSTATANAGYRFAGWYSDKECTKQVEDDAHYTPEKNAHVR